VRAARQLLTASHAQRFKLSAMQSPDEPPAGGSGEPSARHEKIAMSDADGVLLSDLVKGFRSATYSKALEALRTIHIELHAALPHADLDFDALHLKTQDIGNMVSRTWLPVLKDKVLKGKSKGFINLAHGERAMATLRAFAARVNDVVNYTINKRDGLVRTADAAGPSAPPPPPALALPPPPAPLPDPEAPEEAAASEAEEEEEQEDDNEPLPPPVSQTRAPRCPWQPQGGAPCQSAQHATCSHGACGHSHCALLQSRRGYPPCAVHAAPAG